MSVEQKVKQIIVEQLGVDEAQVDSTASFVDDLGADSPRATRDEDDFVLQRCHGRQRGISELPSLRA